MYKVLIGDHTFNLSPEDLKELDLIPQGSDQYHLIKGGKKFTGKAAQSPISSKKWSVRINDIHFDVTIKDEYDQLIESMGMNAVVKNVSTDEKAPMPGLVLDVLVKEGDQVEEGQNLLILEAMKMENIIKASASATIKEVLVKTGDKVEKLQKMISYA